MAVAILQARMSSSRLPGKVMKPLAGRPMVERQLERLRRCKTLSRLVVATSDDPSDDALASFLADIGVEVHRGPLADVLGRYVGAIEALGISGQVVRLTADCPLADPGVIDDCVRLQASLGVDYCSNGRNRTYPRGLDVEVFDAQDLLTAGRQATDPYDREHVTPFLYRPGALHPGRAGSRPRRARCAGPSTRPRTTPSSRRSMRRSTPPSRTSRPTTSRPCPSPISNLTPRSLPMTGTPADPKSAWAGDFSRVRSATSPRTRRCGRGPSCGAASPRPSGATRRDHPGGGCNLGLNLRVMPRLLGAGLAIEPNATARARVLADGILPAERLYEGFGDKIPLADGAVEMAFTTGVLIHVDPSRLAATMDEIHRVSSKYVLCAEYFSPRPETLSYRGHEGLLFKNDFGGLYMDRFADLQLVDYGFFWKRATGLDDATWWLFGRGEPSSSPFREVDRREAPRRRDC